MQLLSSYVQPLTAKSLYMESLKGPIEIPWAITSLATHPTRKTYVDVSGDLPSHEEYVDASQHPTMHRTFTSKRIGPLESQPLGESHRSRQKAWTWI